MVKIMRPTRRSLANNTRKENISSVMDEAFSTFDRMFSTSALAPYRSEASASNALPRVNLTESDTRYQLEAELAGWSKEDVTVLFDDGVLTVKGERTTDNEADEVSYRHREIQSTSFSRQFKVGSNIDSGNTTARFDNGMLIVDMPKKPDKQPQEIEVETS